MELRFVNTIGFVKDIERSRRFYSEVLGLPPITCLSISLPMIFKHGTTSFLAAGVEFIHPVKTLPHGEKAFRFHDADGHIVEIGEG